MGGICIKRPIKYTFGVIEETSVKETENKQQINSNSYINIGQHQSLNAIKAMDEMIKAINIENHPSMHYQNIIYQAKEENDLQTLINLMNLDEPTAYQIEMRHPWASSPQTIGSVSLMYMQILLIREIQQGEERYEQQEEVLQQNIQIILKNNVISQLEKNLQHKDLDRIQISVLMMVFLIEHQQVIQCFYEQNVFYSILPFIHINDKYPIGFRIAIAFLCKELYKNNQSYIKIFLQDKLAIDSIIDFLYSDNILFIIEGLNNIDELCKDDEIIKLAYFNPFEILYDYGLVNHLLKIQNKLELLRQPLNEELDIDMQSDRNFTISIIKSLINRICQNSKKKI